MPPSVNQRETSGARLGPQTFYCQHQAQQGTVETCASGQGGEGVVLPAHLEVWKCSEEIVLAITERGLYLTIYIYIYIKIVIMSCKEVRFIFTVLPVLFWVFFPVCHL